tara:strand:+ start:158 stop:1531 length:1374 start_codon:yes stop_codon:yes gene_type:complete
MSNESRQPRTAGLAEMILNNFDKSLDKKQREELQRFVKEAESKSIKMKTSAPGIYHGNRYFWNNDTLVRKNEEAYAIIRMASSKVNGIESFKSFNYFTCDGQTMFCRDGNEYTSIIGSWELDSVPGVTALRGLKLKAMTNWRGFNSKFAYSAGIVDGNDAACGFITDKVNRCNECTMKFPPELFAVTAHKSWFIFGDTLLALGAGLVNRQSQSGMDMVTTIDQTLWKGSLSTSQDSRKPEPDSGESISLTLAKGDKPAWIKQKKGFRYNILPEYTDGKVEVRAGKRKAEWNKVYPNNKNIKNKTRECNVLQVSINHGKDSSPKSYAYTVNLGSGDNTANARKVRVITNTTELQAAESADGLRAAGIFFSGKNIMKASSGQYSINAPGALFVRKENGKLHVSVCDALMNTKLDRMTFKTTCRISGKGVSKSGDWYIATIDLPKEPYRGKYTSATFDCK